MTKRRYRPYRSRKDKSRRRVRYIVMALIVLIVGVVIVVRSTSRDRGEPEVQDEVRPIGDVLPPTEPATNSEPQATAPVVIEPQPENAVAADPTPARQEQVTEPAPIVQAVQDRTGIQSPPEDVGTTSPQAMEFINKAVELRGDGKIIAARDLLNHSLDLKLSSAMRAEVKQRLSKMAEVWLFSKDVYEADKLTSYYLVQPGDLLAVIANRYKVPYEVLMQINGIDRPELLQAGAKIKVIQGPLNAVIYKSSFTMDLYLQDVYLKTYRVGLGKAEYETPTGLWRVQPGGKLIQPKWTDPDTGKVYVGSAPDYPLGSRWIALEGLEDAAKGRTGFAIHGTREPETIGTRSSRGCIRLYNGDVIEVYNLLREGISQVRVIE